MLLRSTLSDGISSLGTPAHPLLPPYPARYGVPRTYYYRSGDYIPDRELRGDPLKKAASDGLLHLSPATPSPWEE
jgi:hypothetical protein